MADQNGKTDKQAKKSSHAEREERILNFWKENNIFEKSLEKNRAKGKRFIFYEGPPTANGHPGIHHLEARAFKDAIPRYKTMRGYYVRRKGGWDTHGLPVELQVEKELGLKSKKEIEKYGIAAFNEKCRESVWKYVEEWKAFTERMGYWVDLKDPYIPYKPEYIESLWNIVKTVNDKGLLYKDYKVVPWCPRCGTALSSHELAQGYENVKDLSVYVKFKAKRGQKVGDFVTDDKTSLLAWTTTPWTLPGNVGLAVNSKIKYVEVGPGSKDNDAKPDHYILSEDRFNALKDKFDKYFLSLEIIRDFNGSELVGLEYESLYPFIADNITGKEKEKLSNAYKVYTAAFVTTEDGTGIVHTAVMYGQDDFELGTKVGLPKYHLVNEDGTFKKEAGFLAGAFVKDPNTDVTIIKDLAGRDLLFAKEKYEHSYPFCWRCKTPLIYFARDSWYIKMSALRDELVKENQGINWEPSYIKDGRFGEWLSEVKDWAISRERYWGTPLPVWICEKCHEKKVAGSVADVSRKPRNTYYVMRHGEAENNTLRILDSSTKSEHHLTEKGKKQAKDSAMNLKKLNIDLVIASPVPRTKETAEIVADHLSLKPEQLIVNEKIKEYDAGIFEGGPVADLSKACEGQDRYLWRPEKGEDYADVRKRMGDFLYDLDNKYEGKTILLVTHETPAMLLCAAAAGLDMEQTKKIRQSGDFMANAEVLKVDFSIIPHNSEYELDLHRPYIDDIKLTCACDGEMSRIKEVMDVWFDSGAMPFAEDHYPFENKEYIDGEGYPADFISEAIDQTRGWFYTLHAVGVLMDKGKSYRNVICLGHILDPEGKKMSKSLGNIVNPWDMMEKYGADALRFWMYSVNQPGESKNFDERTVDEVVKKVFNLTTNVLSFYEMYAAEDVKLKEREIASSHVLDRWIIAKLDRLIDTVTRNLEDYMFFEPSRAIRDFIADLSQWYLRRSRDRFKKEGKNKVEAMETTKHVLLTLSKILAPFAPFLAEHVYQTAGGAMESVHLESWPVAGKIDPRLFMDMEVVRAIASKGLEARMAAKINVRQPLQRLEVKASEKLDVQAVDLIKDEVNVKEVVFGAQIEDEVSLDIAITPALKEEGMLRELIRAVQGLRKEKGLTINDRVVLLVETGQPGKDLIEKNRAEISRIASLEEIRFQAVDAKPINIAGIDFKMNAV